jgi:hypothetical protein
MGCNGWSANYSIHSGSTVRLNDRLDTKNFAINETIFWRARPRRDSQVPKAQLKRQLQKLHRSHELSCSHPSINNTKLCYRLNIQISLNLNINYMSYQKNKAHRELYVLEIDCILLTMQAMKIHRIRKFPLYIRNRNYLKEEYFHNFDLTNTLGVVLRLLQLRKKRSANQ